MAILGYYEWGLSLPLAAYGYVRDFFFMGQHYMSWQLWYLLAMIYGVCMINVFQKIKISIEGCVVIGGLLTFIGMLMDVIHEASLQNSLITSIVSGYFELFRTVRNGIFNGFLFIVLGMLLYKYQKKLNRISKLVIFTVLFLFAGLYLYDVPFALHLLSFILLYCVLLIRLPDASCYIWLRNMSTLIYFSHMLFVAFIKYEYPTLSSFGLKWIFVSLLSFFFSAIVLLLANRRLRFLNNLLGK